MLSKISNRSGDLDLEEANYGDPNLGVSCKKLITQVIRFNKKGKCAD